MNTLNDLYARKHQAEHDLLNALEQQLATEFVSVLEQLHPTETFDAVQLHIAPADLDSVSYERVTALNDTSTVDVTDALYEGDHFDDLPTLRLWELQQRNTNEDDLYGRHLLPLPAPDASAAPAILPKGVELLDEHHNPGCDRCGTFDADLRLPGGPTACRGCLSTPAADAFARAFADSAGVHATSVDVTVTNGKVSIVAVEGANEHHDHLVRAANDARSFLARNSEDPLDLWALATCGTNGTKRAAKALQALGLPLTKAYNVIDGREPLDEDDPHRTHLVSLTLQGYTDSQPANPLVVEALLNAAGFDATLASTTPLGVLVQHPDCPSVRVVATTPWDHVVVGDEAATITAPFGMGGHPDPLTVARALGRWFDAASYGTLSGPYDTTNPHVKAIAEAVDAGWGDTDAMSYLNGGGAADTDGEVAFLVEWSAKACGWLGRRP